MKPKIKFKWNHKITCYNGNDDDREQKRNATKLERIFEDDCSDSYIDEYGGVSDVTIYSFSATLEYKGTATFKSNQDAENSHLAMKKNDRFIEIEYQKGDE